jgi:hypothetical protein
MTARNVCVPCSTYTVDVFPKKQYLSQDEVLRILKDTPWSYTNYLPARLEDLSAFTLGDREAEGYPRRMCYTLRHMNKMLFISQVLKQGGDGEESLYKTQLESLLHSSPFPDIEYITLNVPRHEFFMKTFVGKDGLLWKNMTRACYLCYIWHDPQEGTVTLYSLPRTGVYKAAEQLRFYLAEHMAHMLAPAERPKTTKTILNMRRPFLPWMPELERPKKHIVSYVNRS